MTHPKLTALAQSLPASVPFVGPETQERLSGQPFAARLGANENSFGPSPQAIAAMQNAARDVWMYGDPESHGLRSAIAHHHNCPLENIIVGEGIDALLGYLVRLFIGNGDGVVTSSGAYPTFNYHVAGFGGVLYTVPYHQDHEDLTALCRKATDVNAKLVYFANPDNPMGTWITGQNVHTALDHLPKDTLLIVDEAYVEFAPDGTALEIDIEDPRVIRMRTFSKAYGMAGARVGYALACADLIMAFHKIRNHFGMCRISQAGALAALQDQKYLAKTVQKVADGRQKIADIARDNGLTALPSATNFVAIDCGKDGAFAQAVLQNLTNLGIFVRKPSVVPLDRCIRVSVGNDADLAKFATALPRALAQAQDSS